MGTNYIGMSERLKTIACIVRGWFAIEYLYYMRLLDLLGYKIIIKERPVEINDNESDHCVLTNLRVTLTHNDDQY